MRLLLALTAAVVTAAILTATAQAKHYPRHVPKHWHAPHYWLAQAVCIHGHEGAWDDNTGNSYFGGMQFLRSTWETVGGPHDQAFDHPGDRRYPFTQPIREQLYRAWLVWKHDGGSWSEWGTKGACGLA